MYPAVSLPTAWLERCWSPQLFQFRIAILLARQGPRICRAVYAQYMSARRDRSYGARPRCFQFELCPHQRSHGRSGFLALRRHHQHRMEHGEMIGMCGMAVIMHSAICLIALAACAQD